MNALYILLLEGDTDRVLDAIASVLGRKDPQAQAFARLWKALDDTLRSEARLTSHEPQYMLDCAWQAFGKAEIWQKTALRNNAEGRAANDRLDTAMRLFSYASGGESNGVTAAHTIDAFIEQVRALAIEADSLAHTAPIDQAVTLTTPAGAAGKHWKLVFMPAVPTRPMAEPLAAQHPVRRGGARRHRCCMDDCPTTSSPPQAAKTRSSPRCSPPNRKASLWRSPAPMSARR